MLRQKNIIEVSVGLGILEGHLRESKDCLSHLHNKAEDLDLKHEIIDIVHSLRNMMNANTMHLTKLSYDKAASMKDQINLMISQLGIFQRKIDPDLLSHVGRAVAKLNMAKDVLQEVINDLTTEVAQQVEEASQIYPQ